MSKLPGTLETVALEVSDLLTPLRSVVDAEEARKLLIEIGIPVTTGQANTLATPLSNLASKTERLGDLAFQLMAALDADDVAAIASKSIEMIGNIRDVIAAIPALANAIGGLNLPDVTPQVVQEIPRRLLNHLIVLYLDQNAGLNEVLEFFGILERIEHNSDSEDPNNPPFTLAEFHFNKIGDWLKSPATELRAAYKWGDAAFDGLKILKAIENFITRIGFPALVDDTAIPPRLDAVFFEILPKTDIDPKGLELDLKTQLSTGTLSFEQ